VFFSDSDDEVEERRSVVDSDNESEHVGGNKTSRGEFMSSHCPWICNKCGFEHPLFFSTINLPDCYF